MKNRGIPRVLETIRQAPGEVSFFVATVLVTQLLGAGVLLYSTDFAWAILAVQMILGALAVRYCFRSTRAAGRVPLLLFPAPIVSTLLGVWWIVPALSAPDVPPALAVFFWALISFAAACFSVLLAALVLAPLELIGRALIAASRREGNEAVGLFLFGLWILLVPAIIVAGFFAVDDLPGPVRGSYAALAALLGMNNEIVRNEAALWIARICFIMLLVPLFGASRRRRDRADAVRGGRV